MIYDRGGATRDPLKQDLAPKFFQNQKKLPYFNWNAYQLWSNTPYKKQMIELHLFLSWR